MFQNSDVLVIELKTRNYEHLQQSHNNLNKTHPFQINQTYDNAMYWSLLIKFIIQLTHSNLKALIYLMYLRIIMQF